MCAMTSALSHPCADPVGVGAPPRAARTGSDVPNATELRRRVSRRRIIRHTPQDAVPVDGASTRTPCSSARTGIWPRLRDEMRSSVPLDHVARANRVDAIAPATQSAAAVTASPSTARATTLGQRQPRLVRSARPSVQEV